MRLFGDPSVSIDDPWMRRAHQLAERGRGSTSPNPVVGCVIVRSGDTVAEGWHERAGGPHAEAAALASAQDRARGATAYVTLEPCNHHGRTPPCTDALVSAGVTRVVVGLRDPNPGVRGGGVEALRSSGVDVEISSDPGPFREQNEAWLHWIATGRPWLRAKVALSLDGRPSLAPGTKSALTGAGALEVTMRLRAASDAVLVGASTQRIDDPRLTVRNAGGEPMAPGPLRVVLARHSVPAPSGLVFEEPGRSLVLVGDGADPSALSRLEEAGVAVATYDAERGLAGALAALGRRGIVNVLLEPGPGLFTAAWDAGAIDELIVFHAGGVVGPDAPALYGGNPGPRTSRLETAMRAVEAGVAVDDAVSVWRRRT